MYSTCIHVVFMASLLLLVSPYKRQKKCHLQPFGCHKPPRIQVEEYEVHNSPPPKEFFSKYVKYSKPTIFRSAIKDSVAFNYWTDEYIHANFGEQEVRLEAKHERMHLPAKGERYLGRDTLRHFVQTYHDKENNAYIVSDLPEKMYKDVGVVPSFGACGEMSKRIVEVDLWWSGGGTTSVIHKDEYHQINCLINGTKHWKMIDLKYEKYLYKHPEPSYELGGFSDIDPNRVDLNEHPDVVKTEWSNFSLNAGDCLFLPKGYYHQVNSFGTNNLAVSILFSRFDGKDSIDFSDCKDPINMTVTKSLAEYDVQWKWEGMGEFVMGRQDLEQRYRSEFAQSIRAAEQEGRQVGLEELTKIVKDKFPIDDLAFRKGSIREAFAIIDKNKDRVVSSEEIDQLSWDGLREVANEIEPYEPSSTYLHEYSIISYETVWAAMKICLSKNPIITENLWLTHYRALGGTDDFGREIYERLSGGKKEIKREMISDEDIWKSMENWAKYWAPQYSSLTERPNKDNLFKILDSKALVEDQTLDADDFSQNTLQTNNVREEL